jgi:hypothetical protein
VIQESTMQATLPLAPRNSMPSLVMAGAVALLALPSAVLAFSTRFDTVIENASADPIRAIFPQRNGPQSRPRHGRPATGAIYARQGGAVPFHPRRIGGKAGPVSDGGGAGDAETARAIVVRGPSINAPRIQNPGPNQRVAPNAYNLGLSRGYQVFRR